MNNKKRMVQIAVLILLLSAFVFLSITQKGLLPLWYLFIINELVGSVEGHQ